MKSIQVGNNSVGVLLKSGRVLTDDAQLKSIASGLITGGASMRRTVEDGDFDVEMRDEYTTKDAEFPEAVEDTLFNMGYNIVPLSRDKMKTIWNELGKVIEGH
jgi:hypothetical protein